jgi:hypothetical protein
MDVVFDYIDEKTEELKAGLDAFQDKFNSFGENVYQSGVELAGKLQDQAEDAEEYVVSEFEELQENVADFTITAMRWMMTALAVIMCLMILYITCYCCRGKKKKVTTPKDSIV